MTAKDYWVDLFQAERRLGAGFLLTRQYVLTASHCLQGLDPFGDQVGIRLADGRQVSGRVCQQAKDADLALIEIAEMHRVGHPLPGAGIACTGDRWQGPYRPAPGEARLSGTVDHGRTSHKCEAGGLIEALQLTADQHLGDYSGYSGGPVEGAAAGREPVVFGILLEQVLDRCSSDGRAANVLIAATLGEALRRFDQFAVGHLIDVLRPPSDATAAALPGHAKGRTTENIARGEALLEALQQWSERGLIDVGQADEFRIRALQRLIDGQLGGGGDD